MSLKETLLMPHTDFEMRGNLAKKEPIQIEKWQQMHLYEQMRAKNKGHETFHLHDGPPYANGDIHAGHTLNRILKDIIIRYKNMQGYDTPFVFGWDTHGLPIEVQVTKMDGVDRKHMAPADFRKLCENYAYKQVNKQKQQVMRLGVIGDFDHPYVTLDPKYEASQLTIFKKLALNGLIYKGEKPVYWSPSSETALAEAEIEYQDVESHAIYVKFPVKDGKGIVPNDASLVIWTTTPWTLPANLAISVHPRFTYGVYQTNVGKLVFLVELAPVLIKELGLSDVKLLQTVVGQDLEFVTTTHPFYDRESVVIVGDHVTDDAGTGLVHTAPGHGDDDYKIGVKYGLPPFSPVDARGLMTSEAGPRLEGMFYEKANDEVLAWLNENNMLLKDTVIVHSYPHDWRTHKPLIFRSTPQWFMSLDKVRQDVLNAVKTVKWTPSWGESRMYNMIKERTDWVISRQRVWGVPIPIIYNEDGTAIIDEDVFDHIIALVEEHGSNIWFSSTVEQLLPKGYSNPRSPNNGFYKETDTMDVWFDSGSSFEGVVNRRNLKYPADLYLEGSDQYRGWFNSSLILSVATHGVAPYKAVLSHGFIMDDNGAKMSKSKGNVVDPLKIANQYGSDILRLWVANIDYQSDVRLSEAVIKQTSEIYRKIRNTMKFMLGNLQDGDRPFSVSDTPSLFYIDSLMLNKLYDVSNKILAAYDKYQFGNVISLASTFISSDLSSFYLDFAKDILYCEAYNSSRRKSVQYVLYHSLDHLMRLLTPILSFTMDEVYAHFPASEKVSNVQLLDMPLVHNVDNALLNDYNEFNKQREIVLKALEEARGNGIIGSAQEASVTVPTSLLTQAIKELSKAELARLFIVSEVKLADISEVVVTKHVGKKCDRCWNYFHEPLTQLGEEHVCARCLAATEKNNE